MLCFLTKGTFAINWKSCCYYLTHYNIQLKCNPINSNTLLLGNDDMLCKIVL